MALTKLDVLKNYVNLLKQRNSSQVAQVEQEPVDEAEIELTKDSAEKLTDNTKNGGDRNKFWAGVGYLGQKAGYGALRSIEGITDFVAGGIADLFGGGKADEFAENMMKNDWINYERPDEWYDPGKVMSVIGDASQGIGGMLPSVAVALVPGVGGALSTASFATGAAGQGTAEKVQENAASGSEDSLTGKEWGYGAAQGVLEAAIEKLSGGIGGSKPAQGVASSLTKKLGSNVATRLAGNFVGEGLEEVASDVVNPLVERAFGYEDTLKDAYADTNAKSLLRTGLVGGLSGVGMSFASTGFQSARAKGYNNLVAAETAQTLNETTAKANVKQAEGKEASKIRTKTIQNTAENLSKRLQKMDEGTRQQFLARNANIAYMFNTDGTIAEAVKTSIAEGVDGTNAGANERVNSGNYNADSYSAALRGFEGNLEYKPISNTSSTTKVAKDVMNTLTKLTDGKAKIVLTNDVLATENGQKANGLYKDGVIYLDANATDYQKALFTGVHEVVHTLEGTNEYNDLAKFISKTISESPELQGKYGYEKYRAVYDSILEGDFSEGTKDYQASTEIFADFLANEIAVEPQIVRSIAARNRGVVARFLNWIRNSIAKLGRSPQENEMRKQLTKLEKLFADALEVGTGGIALEGVDRTMKAAERAHKAEEAQKKNAPSKVNPEDETFDESELKKSAREKGNSLDNKSAIGYNKSQARASIYAQRDISEVTETDYNHHYWAFANNVITKSEWGVVNSAISDIKLGKKYPKTPNNLYMIPTGEYKGVSTVYNKVVVTDGVHEYPSVELIIEFDKDYEEKYKYIGGLFDGYEIGLYTSRDIWGIIERYNEMAREEVAREYRKQDFPNLREFKERARLEKTGNIANKNIDGKQNGRRTAEKVERDSIDIEYANAIKNGNTAVAQKMVDKAAKEAGYDKKRFHETKEENIIHVFNLDLNTNASADYGTPFGVFTKSHNRSVGLGGKQMSLYVKADRTFSVKDRTETPKRLPQEYSTFVDKINAIDAEYDSKYEQLSDDLLYSFAEWLDENDTNDKMRNAWDVSKTLEEQFGEALPKELIEKERKFLKVSDEWHKKTNQAVLDAKKWLTKWLRENHYDSMELEFDNGAGNRVTDALIVLDQEQVKSAEPATYDDNGNLIPLSKRFNKKSADIRYSIDVSETTLKEKRTMGSARFSLAKASEIAENQTAFNEKMKFVVDENVLKKGIESTARMVKLLSEHKDILPEDRIGKVLKSNSSYDKSVENTTICVRTLAYNEFIDMVSEEVGRPLTQAESFLVSQKLYEIAVDPQCLYCYVSIDRKAYNEFLIRYINERDKVMDAYKKSDKSKQAVEDLYEKYRNKRKDTGNMRTRFDMFIEMAKKGITPLTAKEVSTKARQSEIASRNDYTSVQWKDMAAYAQSASWAKKQFDYVAYYNDILTLSQQAVNSLNKHYGLRFYSFSDYTAAFIVENMQQVTDAAIRGLRGLGYTKDTDFARIFAPTGMNINISMYAYKNRETGEWDIDPRQSANLEEAIKLREEYPNVGIVVTATTDEGVEWALKQKWSDVVIPFHIVRTGADVAEFYKWQNYTTESADTISDDNLWKAYVNGRKKVSKNIYPAEHQNDRDTYFKLIKERGLKPRFERFKDNPNYMKLVNETRQSAQDTKPMQPIFDEKAAVESFNKFAGKGGYFKGWYKEGVDVKTEVKAVAKDVQAGKKANEVEYGRQDVDFDKVASSRKANRTHSRASIDIDAALADFPSIDKWFESLTAEELRELIDNDYSVKDISEELNVEPQKLRYLIKREGLGNSYVEDSKKAVMKQTRIDEAIEDSGASNPTYARDYITAISPKDFIDLTVMQNHMDRDSFDKGVIGDHGGIMGEYDYEKALQTSRSPYLQIDKATGRVIGHNGRHRIRALEKAGIESVEIQVEFFDEDGRLMKYGAETISKMAISSQFDTDIETTISKIIPLNESHRAEIENTYGERATPNAGVRYSLDTELDQKTSKRVQTVVHKESVQEVWDRITKELKYGAKNKWLELQISLTDEQAGIVYAGKNLGLNVQGDIQRARSAKAAAQNMITYKQIDYNGNIVGESLRDIFKPIQKKGEQYAKSFNEYLLHYLNVDRMSSDTNVQAKMQKLLKNNPSLDDAVNGRYDNEAEWKDAVAHADGGAEYLALMETKNKPVFEENVTKEFSLAKVNELEAKHPSFKAAAEKVWKYSENLLQYRVEAGLITQEQADHMKQLYPHYVPAFYDTTKISKSGASAGKNNISVRTGIKAAKGSSGKADLIDVSVSLSKQTESVVKAAAINKLVAKMYDKAVETNTFIDLEVAGQEKVTDPDVNYDDTVTKDNQISFYKDGERITLDISEYMYKGFEGLGAYRKADVSPLESAASKWMNTFKKLVTSANPFFAVRNAARDFTDAWFHTKYNGFTYILREVKSFFRVATKLTPNSEYKKLWDTYVAMGGFSSGYYDSDVGVYDNRNVIKRGYSKLIDLVERANNYIEQTPRFAEFVASVKAGNSYERALYDSAEVTTNFSRGGRLTKKLNRSLIPFLNPAVQGWSKEWRMWVDPMDRVSEKKFQEMSKTSKGMLYLSMYGQLAMKIVALGIGAAALNDLLYGGLGDEDEEYAKIPINIKENNFLIKTGDGKFIKLPKGRVIALYGQAVTRILDYNNGNEEALDAWGWFKSAWDMISPIEAASRSLFAPIGDVISNRTWYGTPIESRTLEQMYEAKDRYDENTSSIAIAIGQALNVSPKKVHYIIDQYSGVIGDIVLPRTTEKAEQRMWESNFIVDTAYTNNISTKYYDLKDELTYAKNSGDLTALMALKYLNASDNLLSDIYKAKRDIANYNTLSAEEKKLLISTLPTLSEQLDLANKNTLTDAEKREYTNILQALLNGALAQLTENVENFQDITISKNFASDFSGLIYSDMYNEFDESKKNSAYNKAMDYYYAVYMAEMKGEKLGYKYVLYDAVGANETCLYLAEISKIESDKDRNGNTISGSRKRKVQKYIQSLSLSAQQKNILLYLAGYTPTDAGRGAVNRYLLQNGFTRKEVNDLWKD